MNLLFLKSSRSPIAPAHTGMIKCSYMQQTPVGIPRFGERKKKRRYHRGIDHCRVNNGFAGPRKYLAGREESVFSSNNHLVSPPQPWPAVGIKRITLGEKKEDSGSHGLGLSTLRSIPSLHINEEDSDRSKTLAFARS